MTGQRNSHGKRHHSHSDYDNGRSKRRNPVDDRDQFVITSEDTVYRYLCPIRKIGSVIGRGGEIVKQLRIDTQSKIRIGETVPGCEERIVTIYSTSKETNSFEDSGNYVSPAQDALFRIHDRVVAEEVHDEESEGGHQVTARLLVPSDQIGCIIGKGGQIVQNIRSDTGAQIRILKDDRLPPCALSSDELVQWSAEEASQFLFDDFKACLLLRLWEATSREYFKENISGDASIVKKAFYEIASRLHDNPSRSQHLLTSTTTNAYPSGGSIVAPTHGGPIVGLAPLMGHYGGYKADSGDWPRSLYSAPRDEASSKEFSLCLVCPTSNIGGVIGKGGAIVNQIRQETRAMIKVDSSTSEGDDCLINVSAKEFFEDTFSPTIEAAVRLQPRCSDKVERDSGIISFTTRLLVPTSRIGCLIGKGGAIITEMRRLTKANIRILSKENLPKVASEDDEMVQIAGDLDVAKDALIQVATRLRANVFDREGAVSSILPVLSYMPLAADVPDSLNYESRDGKKYGRGHSYSGGYDGSSDLGPGNDYESYGGSQISGSGNAYGAYGSFTLGRSGGSGASGPGSRRRNYGY